MVQRDQDRIDVLDGLSILDSGSEPEFDNLVIAARALCQVPVSLISLVHRDRQWFKARSGFEPHETPIDQSVCVHALGSDDLLVIPDLRDDPRTCDNTLVTEDPHLRFYAGAPLIVDGHAIGSLCVIDTVPRPQGLTEEQAQALRALASQVVSQIEARQRGRIWLAEIEQQNIALRSSADQSLALFRLGDLLQSCTTQAQALEIGSSLMAEVLSATRAGFGIVDPERETVQMQPEWRAPGVTSLAGVHHFRNYGSFIDDLKRGDLVIVQDTTTDPRTARQADNLIDIGIRVLINVPVFQNGRFVLVGFVHYDWPRQLTERDAAFIRTVADRIQSAVAHLRAVEERRILNRELSHRLKNTFAMITAIARQSFPQDREAMRAFSARLAAVGAAYDLLAHERWQATDMAAVVGSAIAVAGGEQRVVASGPHVPLGADAAMTVSLLLHELTTNALKYGALSVPGGQVRIQWHTTECEVELRWTEAGGPTVVAPVRRGFGTRLVSIGIGGDRPAQVEYAPEGVRVTASASYDELAQ